MVAIGFGLGQQFPSLALNPPHLLKQVVAQPLLAPLTRLHDGLSNVALVAYGPAGDIETRFAMFRNGSPVARALSITPLSELAQAKQVLGI